jgi:hypothetical protein
MTFPLRVSRIKAAVPQLAAWGDSWMSDAGILLKLSLDATL